MCPERDCSFSFDCLINTEQNLRTAVNCFISNIRRQMISLYEIWLDKPVKDNEISANDCCLLE